MRVPVYLVDAFTDRPFGGNPAAVCLPTASLSEETMQNIAAEMNHSETAFLVPDADIPGHWQLRWFTPTMEVELCGHATLAASHVLWREAGVGSGVLEFSTASGCLRAGRSGEDIELDFPAEPAAAAAVPPGLTEALRLDAHPRFVGRNRFDYLVVVESEATVRQLKPDLARLRGISARGFIVTARAESEACDFVSRFFAPAAGIDEDPVTGSAHCCLGPYWAKELSKEKLVGRQISRRGGSIGVRPNGRRVCLTGKAITVLRGELNV